MEKCNDKKVENQQRNKKLINIRDCVFINELGILNWRRKKFSFLLGVENESYTVGEDSDLTDR